MSALTVSATALPTPTGARTATKAFGETITAGMPVYLSASDGKVYKADANAAGKKTVYGIAMNGGVLDENCVVLLSCTGPLTICASGITVGTVYCLGGTAGQIVPWADVASGDDVDIIGVGYSATQLAYQLFNSAVAHV